MSVPAKARSASLDGLRGVLAVIVFANHLAVFVPDLPGRGGWLVVAANFSVAAFFAISGYVLTGSYDGDLFAFLVKRFLRLWPVFALCLALGYLVAQITPTWTQFFWWPVLNSRSQPEINPPIWSLCVEAWAMPFMGVISWAGRGPPWRLLTGIALAWTLGYLNVKFLFGLFFLAGAFMSRFPIRLPGLDAAAPQFLGRISYSLYLVHFPLLAFAGHRFGPVGALVSVPPIFAASWALCRFVDEPSVRLSRRAAKWTQLRVSGPAARWLSQRLPVASLTRRLAIAPPRG